MKQHYIPRCYLKRFSDNNKSIFSYDKINSKSYQASLMSVCCEDDLYSLSESYVEECIKQQDNLNTLSIECDYFSKKIEPLLAQYLGQLDVIQDGWVKGTERYRLNYLEKRELALHIITLYFRIPHVMNAMIDNHLRFERAEADMIKHILSVQTSNKAFNELELEISCEKPVLHAQISYLNDELLMDMANILANNIYVFFVSENNELYSSDFPIVVNPYVPNIKPICMGLAQYGGELTMPLSPSLSISIYDRKYFKDKEELDSCFIIANDEEILRRNWRIYLYAKRHVFSLKNDFRMIDVLYEKEGKHVFYSPNLKEEIVSGLGRY